MIRVYVIYRSPLGAPGPFALCAFDCEAGGKPSPGEAEFVPTLDEARAKLPEGLKQRKPSVSDSPFILEVWSS